MIICVLFTTAKTVKNLHNLVLLITYEYFPSQNQANYKQFMPLLGKSKWILFEK